MAWPFTLQDTATALLILVGGIASFFGISKGRNPRNRGSNFNETFEVAAALISNKKADEIVHAFNENTKATLEQVAAIEGFHDSLREIKSDIKDMLRETRIEVREYLRDLRNMK
jgi:hypothetical protein